MGWAQPGGREGGAPRGLLVRSLLQVPLTVGKKVIGVLGVDNQQAERPFTENDQYLLAALADYAAIAIENARL
ncbi:MAG: GAF domain-containing protein, partial [Ilumatobacteraceae bacterium]|nr:GAF domain-containing protein [Ilumatobacteraceae bacterium]